MRRRNYKISPEALECRVLRSREVRDIYNKLRKKYRSQTIDQFFRENYFLQPRTVERIVIASDTVPVDESKASIIYRTAMDDDFNL